MEIHKNEIYKESLKSSKNNCSKHSLYSFNIKDTTFIPIYIYVFIFVAFPFYLLSLFCIFFSSIEMLCNIMIEET